jgi:hypothetical protein
METVARSLEGAVVAAAARGWGVIVFAVAVLRRTSSRLKV